MGTVQITPQTYIYSHRTDGAAAAWIDDYNAETPTTYGVDSAGRIYLNQTNWISANDPHPPSYSVSSCSRTGLYFDTSSVSLALSATLYITPAYNQLDTDNAPTPPFYYVFHTVGDVGTVNIVNAPSLAQAESDYLYLRDCTTVVGSLALGGTIGVPSAITIDPSYINTGGITKFGARLASEQAAAFPKYYDAHYSTSLIYLEITTNEVTTVAATNINQASATLNGTETGCAYTYFEYGRATTDLTFSTPTRTAAATFSEGISGLSPNVTYYFRAVGYTGATYSNGSVLNFTTYETPVLPPENNPNTYGYMWTEGEKMHFISTDGVERAFLGTNV